MVDRFCGIDVSYRLDGNLALHEWYILHRDDLQKRCRVVRSIDDRSDQDGHSHNGWVWMFARQGFKRIPVGRFVDLRAALISPPKSPNTSRMQLGIVPLDCVCKKECEGIASQLAVGMLFGDHRGKSP